MVTPSSPTALPVKIDLRLLIHIAVLALLWWLLTAGRWDSWIVGGPTVLVAAVCARVLAREKRWRCSPLAFMRFVLLFARDSFVGGWDVARRSLHPELPIDPQLLEYRLHLTEGTPRVFFLNVINLLPGTVSVDVKENDVLVVHAIDGRQDVHHQLSGLEQLVAELFAMQIEVSPSEGDRMR